MASPNQWTWVWMDSGSWWWTGRPGVLWFMGSQRVGHDWATELNWTEESEWNIKVAPKALRFSKRGKKKIWSLEKHLFHMHKETSLNTFLQHCSEFTSVTQLCLMLWNSMDYSMPGFSVHHQLLELTQTHIHRVGDAIQPSHPISPPSPPAFNLSQHQGLFQWVSSSYQM